MALFTTAVVNPPRLETSEFLIFFMRCCLIVRFLSGASARLHLFSHGRGEFYLPWAMWHYLPQQCNFLRVFETSVFLFTSFVVV